MYRVKIIFYKTQYSGVRVSERRKMRSAHETVELLRAFSNEILTEAEKKELTRYEVSQLPRILESVIRSESFQREKPYKRNPQP